MLEKVTTVMKIVRPAESLNGDQQMRESGIPTVMAEFLTTLLRRLGDVYGLRFMIGAQPPRSAGDDQTKVIFGKLARLKRAGVVKGFRPTRSDMPDEPPVLGAQVDLVGPRRIGYSGYGRSFSTQAEAWGPAYGEALERWCLEYFTPIQNDTKVMSVRDLAQDGLDLARLPRIAERIRSSPAYKRSYKITDDSEFVCMSVPDLVTGQKQFAPLQWFSFQHAREYVTTRREPQIHPLVTTGAAAGPTFAEAALNGIYEAIERDAFMLHWMNSLTPPRILLREFKSEEITLIEHWSQRYGLETNLLYLRTDFPVHVVLCVILDKSGDGPAVVVDASAGHNVVHCIEKAFLGAVNQRPYLRRQAGRREEMNLSAGALEIESRPFWWYGLERLPALDFLLNGSAISKFPDHSIMHTQDALSSILEVMERKGYQVLCADIIPDSLKRLVGTSVVQIKVPQLTPLHLNEWEKTTDSIRLRDVPRSLGLSPGSGLPNEVPHPFS